MYRNCLLLMLAFLLAPNIGGAATENSVSQVVIVGLNKLGRPVVQVVSGEVFRKTIAKALTVLQPQVDEKISLYNEYSEQFPLSRVTAGIRLEQEFGLGSVASLGTESVFNLRYEPLPRK